MVVGHSFGEIAAATVSGALSVAQATGFVFCFCFVFFFCWLTLLKVLYTIAVDCYKQ